MASEKRGLDISASLKFVFRKLTSFKEERSNLNSVSQHVQSPILSLHSAKRRQDMIESDSN